MKRRAILVAVLAVLIITIAAGAWTGLRAYLATPLKVTGNEYILNVNRGNTLRGVAERLAGRGILEAPDVFTVFARLAGLAGQIKAGEYALKPDDTPMTLLAMLVEGRVKLHSVTIVEGWTVAELLDALAGHTAILHTLEPGSRDKLSTILDLPYPHPEGLFFPDTYLFPRGTPDVDILRQAHELLLARLREAWSGREPHDVLATPYDGLILASIIERETALAGERAKIAGVFIRRLERGMRLQTDPTVIYGLGESFDGNLTRRDLKTDTPYNTYTRNGLPPTPIALPGESALQAMAHPEPGDALYFVATGHADGSHYFTATLAEHNAAVARFLAQIRQQKRLE